MEGPAPLLLACAFSLIYGCAHGPSTPTAVTEWQRVSNVDGCPSFEAYRGRPYDISIVLKPEFQAQLLTQVEQHPLEEPLCWYEKPNKDLLLRAGPFCGSPKEAQFRLDGYKWSLVDMKEMYVQCEPQAK